MFELSSIDRLQDYVKVVRNDRPVSHWPLWDAVAQATDQVGGNLGTFTGGYTQGVRGPIRGSASPATNFDGSTGYVDLGNVSALKPPLPVTIELWINLRSYPNFSSIYASDNQNANYFGFDLGIDNTGCPFVDFGNGGGAGGTSRRSKQITTPVPLNSWHHLVAVIRSATDMTICLDSIDLGGTYSGTGGAIAYSSASSVIAKGGVWGGNLYTPASIAHVAVYNYALPLTRIAAHYEAGIGAQNLAQYGYVPASTNPTPPSFFSGASSVSRLNQLIKTIKQSKPVNLWPLSDATVQATDQSGTTPATLSGTYQQGQGGPLRGGLLRSTRFSGTGGAGAISRVFGTTGTIEVWFKWEDFSFQAGYAAILSDNGGNNALYLLGGLTARMDMFYGGADHLSPVASVPQGVWNHYAFISSAGVWSGYLNLAKVHSGTGWPGGTFAAIGSDLAGDPYQGSLSTLTLYDTALNVDQLTDHYNAMLGRGVYSDPPPMYAYAAASTRAMNPFESPIFNSPVFST